MTRVRARPRRRVRAAPRLDAIESEHAGDLRERPGTVDHATVSTLRSGSPESSKRLRVSPRRGLESSSLISSAMSPTEVDVRYDGGSEASTASVRPASKGSYLSRARAASLTSLRVGTSPVSSATRVRAARFAASELFHSLHACGPVVRPSATTAGGVVADVGRRRMWLQPIRSPSRRLCLDGLQCRATTDDGAPARRSPRRPHSRNPSVVRPRSRSLSGDAVVAFALRSGRARPASILRSSGSAPRPEPLPMSCRSVAR